MLHDGNRAAAEFQKFLDHRGLVRNAPWGALARLGLGRAYAMQGDTPKARTAYQDFLALWKDADPDIPILQEAKAEYARLQFRYSVSTLEAKTASKIQVPGPRPSAASA
jgi:hypothetical protein